MRPARRERHAGVESGHARRRGSRQSGDASTPPHRSSLRRLACVVVTAIALATVSASLHLTSLRGAQPSRRGALPPRAAATIESRATMVPAMKERVPHNVEARPPVTGGAAESNGGRAPTVDTSSVKHQLAATPPTDMRAVKTRAATPDGMDSTERDASGSLAPVRQATTAGMETVDDTDVAVVERAPGSAPDATTSMAPSELDSSQPRVIVQPGDTAPRTPPPGPALVFPPSMQSPNGGDTCGFGAVASMASMDCLPVLQPHTITQMFTGHNTEGHDGDGFGYVSSLDMQNTVGKAAREPTDVVLADAAGPGMFTWIWLASNGFHEQTRLVVEVDGQTVVNVPLGWGMTDAENKRLDRLPFLANCMSDGEHGAHHGISCAMAIPFRVRGRILFMHQAGQVVYHEVVSQQYSHLPTETDAATVERVWRSTGSNAPLMKDTAEGKRWLSEHARAVSQARKDMEAQLARVQQGLPPSDFPVIAAVSSGATPDAATATDVPSAVCAALPMEAREYADVVSRSEAPQAYVHVGEGEAQTLISVEAGCSGVVRVLSLRVAGVDASDTQVMNAIRIEGTWDGGDVHRAPQLDVSLAHVALLSPDDPTYRVHNAFVAVDDASVDGEPVLVVRLTLAIPFATSLRVVVRSVALPAPAPWVGQFALAPEFRVAALAVVAPPYPAGTRLGRLFIRDTPYKPRTEIEQFGQPHTVVAIAASEGAGHLVGTSTVYYQCERPMKRRLVFGSEQTAHEGDAIGRVDGLRAPSLRHSGHEDWYGFGHGYCQSSDLLRGAGYYIYRAADEKHWNLPPNADVPARDNLMSWDAHRLMPVHTAVRWRAGFNLTLDLGDGLYCLNETPVHLESTAFYYTGGFVSPGVGAITTVRESAAHQLAAAGSSTRVRGEVEWVLIDRVDVGDEQSRVSHQHQHKGPVIPHILRDARHYRDFAGIEGNALVQSELRGFVVGGSSTMTIAVSEHCSSVLLQRDFDASYANQGALVHVDGEFAGVWYQSGANSFFKLDQSQFILPRELSSKKSKLTLTFTSIGTTIPPDGSTPTSGSHGGGHGGDCAANSTQAAAGTCRAPNSPVEWESEFVSSQETLDAAHAGSDVDIRNHGFNGRSVPAYRTHWTELAYQVLCATPQVEY